jgi:hypothetical protein
VTPQKSRLHFRTRAESMLRDIIWIHQDDALAMEDPAVPVVQSVF